MTYDGDGREVYRTSAREWGDVDADDLEDAIGQEIENAEADEAERERER